MRIDPSELARALSDLADWATTSAPVPEPAIARRLGEHLLAEPSALPVVSVDLLPFDRPNFQLAVDTYLAMEGRRSELVGLSVMRGYRMGIAELAQASCARMGPIPDPGPIEYETVEIGGRRVLCVKSGVWP